MKKMITLLFLISCLSYGQKRVKFTYDDEGNQIKREICLCLSAKTTEVYKTPATLTESDLIQESEQLSYYPNPVKEELYVKWKNLNEQVVSSIEIYAMNGQLMKSYTNVKDKDNLAIAFQSYPDGFYNLILVYSNGESKTLKIVKN